MVCLFHVLCVFLFAVKIIWKMDEKRNRRNRQAHSLYGNEQAFFAYTYELGHCSCSVHATPILCKFKVNRYFGRTSTCLIEMTEIFIISVASTRMKENILRRICIGCYDFKMPTKACKYKTDVIIYALRR